MRVDRDEVDRQDPHVEGERADALDRVGVERDPPAATDRTEQVERLDRTDLVVPVDDADEHGVLVERPLEDRRVDEPVVVDGEHGEPRAIRHCGQVGRGVAHRVMLDRGRHEPAAVRPSRAQHATQREVVRLGPPSGEDDLGRLGAERGRHGLARAIDERPSRPALGVDAGRVAVRLAEDARHRVGDLGVDGRGGGVVQVDAAHGRSMGAQVATETLASAPEASSSRRSSSTNPRSASTTTACHCVPRPPRSSASTRSRGSAVR